LKVSDFLELIQNTLEIDNINITLDTKLNAIPQMDSLGIMTLVALIDENFDKRFKAQEFTKLNTFNDLIDLIGKENFENN
jgi:acyl carrier protein